MSAAVISNIVTSVVAEELGTDTVEQYAAAIEKVSASLTQAAYDATDHLISIAVNDLGISEDEARHHIESTGLPVRPAPEPEVEDEEAAVDVEDLDLDDRVRKLESGQALILEGLNRLTALAEKHLGAAF